MASTLFGKEAYRAAFDFVLEEDVDFVLDVFEEDFDFVLDVLEET